MPRPAVPRRRLTLRDVRRSVAAWIRSSPGTHTWLLILTVTTAIVAGLSPDTRSYLLHHVSTNLDQLQHHPIRVLVGSALWIQRPSALLLYAALFEVVHATAERWLGTVRWLLVVAAAHVGATLVSEQEVLTAISDDRLPRSVAHTIDVGVSYGLAGVVGMLTYRVPRPWRWGYMCVVLAFFTYRVADHGTFTDLGHLSAVLIGLCCYSLAPPAGPGPRGLTRLRRRRTAAAAPPRCRPRRWTR